MTFAHFRGMMRNHNSNIRRKNFGKSILPPKFFDLVRLRLVQKVESCCRKGRLFYWPLFCTKRDFHVRTLFLSSPSFQVKTFFNEQIFAFVETAFF